MSSFRGVCIACGHIYAAAPASPQAGCTQCWSRAVAPCADVLLSSGGEGTQYDAAGAEYGVGLDRWRRVNEAWRGEEARTQPSPTSSPDAQSDSPAGSDAGWDGPAAAGKAPGLYGDVDAADFDTVFGVVWNDEDLPADMPRSVPLPLVIQMCVMKWEEDE